jgi:hypothetical protein
VWLAVLAAGSVIYFRETRALRRRGVDLDQTFRELPRD